MRYEKITFEEFDENFIQHALGGYYTVYAAFDEDDDGVPQKIIQLDMICEWRLSDGKVKFLSVPFETKEQFDKIIQYLRDTTRYLNESITDNIDELCEGV